MTTTQFATIAEILAATGRTVTDTTRNLAAQSIELHTGLIESVDRTQTNGRDSVSDRDLYFLKLAVCYQAVWLLSQPDYLERNAVSAAAQDGQSATAGNPDWLTLSPMARKALKRLSWRGTRTVSLVGRARPVVVNVNDDDYEDGLKGWAAV